jgi:hypothetical protein
VTVEQDIITWRWPGAAETCSEVEEKKDSGVYIVALRLNSDNILCIILYIQIFMFLDSRQENKTFWTKL